MRALIEQLIADDQERAFAETTRRRTRVPWLPGKADALVGMRRAGKTTRMRQLMQDRLADGYPREALLYLNFEDERLWEMGREELHLIVDVFYQRHPELRARECAFFLDEIQVVPGWERFVRRLLDTEDIHVVVSGSSAKLLSRELETALRGRSLPTEVFPFSFREHLEHFGVELPAGGLRPGKALRSRIEHELGRYLERGGFPEVLGMQEPMRVRVLQEYLDAVILRDVVERHGVTNVSALRRMIRQLINAPAGLVSVHRLYGDLRSQGISVSKDALHGYLDHLHDAYLLFPMAIHTASERRRQSNPRKVYPIDPGVVTACSSLPGRGIGQLLETVVFLHLRRKTDALGYYRDDAGTEVDFVVQKSGQVELVQVSADITSQDTRKRELRALEAAMQELGVTSATLVTLSAEETIQLQSGRADVVPAWRWLLEQD
ncbi:MAG: ATP-binding protein [Myxococcales bacterium]|nr:ATP-binding protein [Myxococcales bacterium]MDD9971780.1 ATP-binding protein [Myxococcales bacterium]